MAKNMKAKIELPSTPHDMLCVIERALREYGFIDRGFRCEPPDGEGAKPDNCAVTKDGECLFVVRVEKF